MKRFILLLAAVSLMGGTLFAQDKSNDKFKFKTHYNTVFDMLREEPGVIVSPTSVGSTPSILVRGISTNSDKTQPLFVVDGIITDDVSYLTPDDVYSIEVLKDGTSAMYGVQGQNGVIIFKTVSAVQAEQREAEMRKAEKQAAREARKAARRNRR